MKKSTNVTLIRSVFLVSALAGSLSFAATKNTSSAITKETQLFPIKASQSFQYPSVTHALFDTNTTAVTKTASGLSQQPLPGIQVVDFALISSSRLQNKNAIFEFAVKFNDTFQQLLSFFNFSSKSKTVSPTENSATKNINLGNNTKSLPKGNCAVS